MLRHLLVTVLYNPHILTVTGSSLDVSILRAAHQALLRHQSGTTDAFLFLFCGGLTPAEAKNAIAPYGFPHVDLLCVGTKDENGDEIDDDEVRAEIGRSISQWLDEHHPAAITSLSYDEYNSLDIWWSGVEATDNDWDFSDDYAETLPKAHRHKSRTWLAILAEMHELEVPCWSNINQLALYAATLCEWLHGFEAASGHSFNDFDVDEVYATLPIDDMYLGILLGQEYSTETFDEILFDAEVDDLGGLRTYALRKAISNERITVRNTLSKYFGADSTLFWALHTSIWPQYNEPSTDLSNNCLNSSAYEDIATNSDAWIFVTDGWSDAADE